MRVTLVTGAAAENGSAHFRLLQYAPLLVDRGLEVTVSSPRVAIPRFGGVAGAGLLLLEHGARYLARAVQLKGLVSESDVVMVQRGAYPIGPSWLLRCLAKFSGRVIYDLDDAVFLPSPNMAHKRASTRWIYRDRQALSLLERADSVIVSTSELDHALPGRRADVVLPTIPDVWAYPVATHDTSRPLRLGWIGSQGNVRYLDPLRGVLGRLAREGVASLEVVASAPWSGPSRFRRWERATETSAVAGFEVGLMPLPEDPYTQAKAGFKLLQYMAAGCAVIASPVGINRALVAESGGGLLASSTDEWEQAIRELAEDTNRRARMGASARRFAQEFADRDAHADLLAALILGEKVEYPTPVSS